MEWVKANNEDKKVQRQEKVLLVLQRAHLLVSVVLVMPLLIPLLPCASEVLMFHKANKLMAHLNNKFTFTMYRR